MRFRSDKQRRAVFANMFTDKPKYLYHKTDADNMKSILEEKQLRSHYTDPVSMTEDENLAIAFRRFEKPVVVVIDTEKVPKLTKMDYEGKDFISHYGRKAWADEKEWNARRVPLDAIVGVTLNEDIRKVPVSESFGGGEIIKGFPSRSVPKERLKDFDFEKEFTRDESSLPYYDKGEYRVFSNDPNEIKFRKPLGLNRKDYALVDVDMDNFDKSWQKDEGYYVGPGGEGGIGQRYENMKKLVDTTTEPIDAPEVTRMHSANIVSFTDGRHRVAALRDLGAKKVTIMVPKEDKEWFEDNFGV